MAFPSSSKSVYKHKVTRGDVRLAFSTMLRGETHVNIQLPLKHPSNYIRFLSARPLATFKLKHDAKTSAFSASVEQVIGERETERERDVFAITFSHLP